MKKLNKMKRLNENLVKTTLAEIKNEAVDLDGLKIAADIAMYEGHTLEFVYNDETIRMAYYSKSELALVNKALSSIDEFLSKSNHLIEIEPFFDKPHFVVYTPNHANGTTHKEAATTQYGDYKTLLVDLVGQIAQRQFKELVNTL